MRTLQRETSQSGKDRYCGAPPVCTSGEVRQMEKAADGRAAILAVGSFSLGRRKSSGAGRTM